MLSNILRHMVPIPMPQCTAFTCGAARRFVARACHTFVFLTNESCYL